MPDSELPGAAAFLGPARRVPVGDIQLAYRQFGRGPELVLIMGESSAMGLWDLSFLQTLSSLYRVTIFDNRGTGYSTDNPDVPMTMELMAQDTAALMQLLGLGPANILGWSMGGQIGLVLAVENPAVVRRLVVSGATPGGPEEIPPPDSTIAILTNPDSTPEELLALLFPDTPAGQAAMVAYAANLALTRPMPVPPVTLQRQGQAQFAFSQDTTVVNRLVSLGERLLITAGGLDVVVPPGNAELIATANPSARKAIFQEAGHAMLFQDHSSFIPLSHGFLSQLP